MINIKPGRAAGPILISFLIICAAVNGCKKSNPANSPANEQIPKKETKESAINTPSAKNPPVSKAIGDIIANRTTWNPILSNFYGREMPDFTVKDINGKVHNLKDYRGRNVMVVMWATWCVPCMQEIPVLKALREIMPADKLAVLAISSEPSDTVKQTAESEGLNYTVISYRDALPQPFSNIRGIPTTFFFRPDGTLKLVVEGGSQLGEMKAIILAD